jgi:predicted nucleotidyltransferase
MGTLTAIRAQRRLKRLNELRQGAQAIGAGRAGAEVWLFGSLARGDWDAYSDVDLLAAGPSKVLADHLADALRLNP